MARTQAPDYDQRRRAILDHAARLFANTGFSGASVSDLAAACETSKSLIYHYYPSKEDILYAVIASHVDQLATDVAEVTGRDAAAPDLLRDLVRAFMRHYVGAAERQKVLLNERDRLPADKRRAILAKQRGIIDAVTVLIRAADPRLAADPPRVRVQTMLLFGMINWTHTWFNPSGPIGAEELADMAVELVLPSPPSSPRA